MKKMKNSKLRFKELTDGLNYIKVMWNGKIVYDDYYGDSSIEDLRNFENKYEDKVVYSMYIEVVEFHHCTLEVEGEE